MTWHAVDAGGRDLATGFPPRPPGGVSPAAAVSHAPVVAWPLAVTGDDGRRLSLAEVLGPGGGRVEALLDALSTPAAVDVEALTSATPAGPVDLPLAVVALPDGVEAAARVDPGWLAEVDRRRAACRGALVEAGRDEALEAAVHVAMLLATERFDPGDDRDPDAHVASGARLWLLAGAVASALGGAEPDPFAAWARLITGGWWPVGPSDGRLVVSAVA